MVIAAYRTGVYNVLLLLHIVAIVAAFAPAVIHPILGAQTQADGEPVASTVGAHMATNTRRVHLPALVVAGLLGLAMVFTSDDVWDFGQAWVSLSLLVWFALCGVVSGLIGPAERRVGQGDAGANRQVQLGGQIATVLVLAQLYLMIWKPGA
jgi:uncharacterized membrane protein